MTRIREHIRRWLPLFFLILKRSYREVKRKLKGSYKLLDDTLGELHGAAVEGPVLTDEDLAVDANDVVVGEGQGELVVGLLVEDGVAVGGHEDGLVDDEEVGIGGWQSFAVLVVANGGHGQRNEAIGVSVDRSEGA